MFAVITASALGSVGAYRSSWVGGDKRTVAANRVPSGGSTASATKASNDAGSGTKNLQPLVVCGPSGVGKGTLIKMLLEDFPGRFGFSVSHTTRKPRPGEVHGAHYHFSEKAAMQAEIDNAKFIEHANVHGNLYGTRWVV
ncbi:unnamed protein product [Sphacelaria rigidula]